VAAYFLCRVEYTQPRELMTWEGYGMDENNWKRIAENTEITFFP